MLLRRSGALALCIVLAVALPPICAAGADPQSVQAIVDETVRPLMARHEIPGMALAVAVDGRIQVFNYGVQSLQSRQPVTDETLFEIGSISKIFTATLAAYAQVLGRLSLNDHPSRFVLSLKGASIDRATLNDLGTYTAGGLPLQFPEQVGDNEAAMAYLRAWRSDIPTGSVREYSNPSAALLGAATAAAMNDDFATLVEAKLLAPLGMRHSHFQVPPPALSSYAWGHRQGHLVRVKPGPMSEAAYGLKSSAADMISFVQANIDPRSLAAPLSRAVEATQVGQVEVGGMIQCLGWERYPYPLPLALLLEGNSTKVIFGRNPALRVATSNSTAPRLFNKTGSTDGFGAYVAFVPEHRIGLVMLANRNYPIAARVEAAHTILSRVTSLPR